MILCLINGDCDTPYTLYICFYPSQPISGDGQLKNQICSSGKGGTRRGLMCILAKYHLLPTSLVLLILLVAWTMGCIQSIACKPRIRRENIVVYEVSASIDQCPTIIEENSPIVLRYKTPYFRASAGVVMPPVPRNETWVVGWIQACTQMEFYNTYGDIGMSSWELPELREGRVKAISDSDGVSYPWYGNTTETVTLTGPTSKPSRLTVSMNDNFYPSVTWAVPISNSNTPMLTHITRDQSFITWLVAMNSVTKERIVLQTVRWRMRVDIAVDPDMPLGSRASLVGCPYQEQPHILNYQEPIPPNALGRPNANDAQVLMWRPRRGAPLVVIPPK
uniref:protein FAM78B n=1 Tax=Scatophagus argus TaxID=75038 RepID=UPI001ED81204|nr:protein FAM78B [Scatophagus argus]